MQMKGKTTNQRTKREKKINDKKELLSLMKKTRTLNIVLKSTDGSEIPNWLIDKLEDKIAVPWYKDARTLGLGFVMFILIIVMVFK